MKGHLQEIALEIYPICLKFNLTLDVVWVPRSDNERADFISRIIDYEVLSVCVNVLMFTGMLFVPLVDVLFHSIIDYDDWSVSDNVFNMTDLLWGPHEVDWFPRDHNCKLTVFYSRYWNVSSIGIDAFTVNLCT